MNRDTDLFFVLARFRFNREGNRGFGILHRVVNDWLGFVADRVAGLRLFQLHARNDVARMRLGKLFELLALHRV